MSSAILRTPVKWYSGFDPRSIPGCQLWVDASDTTAYTLSGSNVATVRDKSGTGKTITVSATPPTYSSNGFNSSYPCFVFTTSNALSATLTTAIGTGNCVLAAVMKNTGTATQNNVLSVGTGGLSNEMGLGWNNTSSLYKFYQFGTGEGQDNTTATNTNMIIIGTRTSSTMAIYNNGKQPTATGTATTNNTNTLIYVGSNTGFTFAGQICEALFYIGTTITTEQRQALEGYLANKWGLSSSLTATQPYKSAPLIRPFTRGFLPNDITNCRLWLDAADASTLTLSGSNVTAWADKSGNGFNATGSGNPVYNSSLQRIQFNGTTSYFSNLTYSLTLGSRTAFVVMSETARNTTGGIFIQIPNPTSGTDYIAITGCTLETSGGITSNGGYVGGTPGYKNTWGNATLLPLAIYGETMSSRTSISYLNGSTANTVTANYDPGTSAGYVLGARWTSGAVTGAYLNGNIYEIIAFNTVLNTSQRQLVEGYLATKWGLSSSLPTTHPFYRNPPLISLFTPLNISSCALWLDASDYTTVTTSGSNVTAWNDKSGNGRNATPYQSPTVTTINGLQAIELGGTKNFDGSITNGTANVTVFAVATTPASATGYPRLVSLATFNTTTDAFTNGFVVAVEQPNIATALGGERNTGTIYSTGAGTVSANVPFIVSSAWTGTTVNMFINGTSRVSATFAAKGNFSYANYAIGRCIQNGFNGTNPTFVWPGSVCEVIIYNAVISAFDRQRIEGYLAWKWRLRSSLPTTHPYYKFRP